MPGSALGRVCPLPRVSVLSYSSVTNTMTDCAFLICLQVSSKPLLVAGLSSLKKVKRPRLTSELLMDLARKWIVSSLPLQCSISTSTGANFASGLRFQEVRTDGADTADMS